MGGIDDLLAQARARLDRLRPHEAVAEQRDGALLVDMRPIGQRARDGDIPGALVIDRNVLEWRLDPTSPHHIPEVTDRNARIVLVCHEGYASSLAAATLQDLGLQHATDLAGGFVAWQEAGLAIIAPPPGVAPE